MTSPRSLTVETHGEILAQMKINIRTAKPPEKVPGKGQLLARATQNLDAMEYSEDRRIVVVEKTCSIRVVLYYDHDYVPVTRVWVTDPDPKRGAQRLKKLPESTNPGVHPGRWFNIRLNADRLSSNARPKREDSLALTIPALVLPYCVIQAWARG
eukprot:3576236-Pyramimonas_sp.AAC.1